MSFPLNRVTRIMLFDGDPIAPMLTLVQDEPSKRQTWAPFWLSVPV